nr:hypothetical protein [Novosphingobium sp. G106]
MCATVLQPVAAMAGTKDFALQGYALPADKPVTIVLMRPDVSVGELTAGGLPQPNADWTKSAREQIEKALTAEMSERQLNFSSMEQRISDYNQQKAAVAQRCAAVPAEAAVPAPTIPAECAAPVPAPASADADPELTVSEYNALHGAVVQAVLAHKYGMGAGKLPTKKENFSYTLGPGAGTLGQLAGANYGLFVMTNDQFASDGRKAMQVMGALGCIIGACMIVRGGVHVAYVSLVELDSGNIVWFNVLRGSDGDVREAEGARTMVRSIMAGMPTRPGELRTAAVAKSR